MTLLIAALLSPISDSGLVVKVKEMMEFGNEGEIEGQRPTVVGGLVIARVSGSDAFLRIIDDVAVHIFAIDFPELDKG